MLEKLRDYVVMIVKKNEKKILVGLYYYINRKKV